MEEGKGARYLASGRQYGNALLGVRHQEEDQPLPNQLSIVHVSLLLFNVYSYVHIIYYGCRDGELCKWTC